MILLGSMIAHGLSFVFVFYFLQVFKKKYNMLMHFINGFIAVLKKVTALFG